MKNKLNEYNNILFIGTGGGNDIFSSLYIADKMRGFSSYSIAGMLSPAATHYFNGYIEKSVNVLDGIVERYLGDKKISFIDSMILDIIDKYKYYPNKVFELSLKYGLNNLIRDFNNLIDVENFDCICFVDMGGDILGRKSDYTLLSPLMDFTCLYLSKYIKIDCLLIEFGLGTDGELRDYSIDNIMSELNSNQMIIDSMTNVIDDSLIRFNNAFEEISKVRLGYATYLTLKLLLNPNFDRNIKFRSSYKFNDNDWKYNFISPINGKYINEIFLIDIKKLVDTRDIIEYDDPINFYIKMKKYNNSWKNEMDCHIVDNTICCAISKLVESKIRNDIIDKCMRYSIENNVKIILFGGDSESSNENIIYI